MVFNQQILLWIIATAAFVWIAALTAWLLHRERLFKRKVEETGESDLRKLLSKIVTKQDELEAMLGKIEISLSDMRRADTKHLQRIGLVRFNPFRDAGGNQSFALAILNEQNAGIVITGLHARDTTRLYIKDVIGGQSKTELSKEERQAIEIAKK